MTEQEFLALGPREQDAVVAKALGWKYKEGVNCGMYGSSLNLWYPGDIDLKRALSFPPHESRGKIRTSPPYFTEDIAAAWEVVEKLTDAPTSSSYGELIRIDYYPSEAALNFDRAYTVTIGPNVTGTANKPALAICIAALKAKGVITE
jgi:hypothetical protein